jgi:hypothetical protein
MPSTDWKPPLNVRITPQFAAIIPLIMAATGDHSFYLADGSDRLEASLFGKVEMMMLCFSDSGDGVSFYVWDGGLDESTVPKALTSFDDALADFDRAMNWAFQDESKPCPELIWVGGNDGGQTDGQ